MTSNKQPIESQDSELQDIKLQPIESYKLNIAERKQRIRQLLADVTDSLHKKNNERQTMKQEINNIIAELEHVYSKNPTHTFNKK